MPTKTSRNRHKRYRREVIRHKFKWMIRYLLLGMTIIPFLGWIMIYPIGFIYEVITGKEPFTSLLSPINYWELWIPLLSSGVVGGWLLGKMYLDNNPVNFDTKDYPLLREDQLTDDKVK